MGGDHSDNTVSKLRASDGATLGTLVTGANPEGLVFDGVNVWSMNSGDNSVSKHEPQAAVRTFVRHGQEIEALEPVVARGLGRHGTMLDGTRVHASSEILGTSSTGAIPEFSMRRKSFYPSTGNSSRPYSSG